LFNYCYLIVGLISLNFQIGLHDFSVSLSSPVGSTQTSSTPILTKANSELTGNRLLASAIGVEKSPSKMSPGRARARSTFAKISGIDDASKHDFLNGHFQWPVSSDRQKIPTLVSLQVSTFF
jgi:hypothetical protein